MQKLLFFFVEFLTGAAVRAVQFALLVSAGALPVPLIFRVSGEGYWDEWLLAARTAFAASMALYFAVRVAKLLVSSWRNEI